MLDITYLTESIPNIEGLSDLPETKVIFCCGYGWSGSGAVYDYFREHPAITVFSAAEMVWMGKHLQELLLNPNPLIKKNFMLAMILGVNYESQLAKGAKYFNLHNSSLVKEFLGRKKDEKAYLRILILDLARALDEGDAILAALKDFFERLFSICKSSHVLVNNSVKLYQLGVSEVMPRNSVFVCVERNFKDQFTELREVGICPDVKSYASVYKRYLQYRDFAAGTDVHCERVKFENFVRDKHYRLTKFKLSTALVRGPEVQSKFFFPEESSSNIDKYSNYMSKEEVAEFETLFSSEL